MQNNTENDIDQHITTLLTDILAPTNYAELKGVLKTVDLLTDYVRLENVRTILEDDVLFRENRDVAVMALDILRKMHDNEQDHEYACEAEVVDTVNEALGRAEPETIPLIENADNVGEVVAVAEPETTLEPAEVEATTVDATETQPEQVSRETQKIDTVIEIPVSSYAVSEDSEVTGTNGDPVDSIDGQTTEPEPVADGSGFPGLPDDEGLSDSADPMEGGAPELESESISPADSPGLPEDSEVAGTNGDPVDSIDSQTTEPEPEPEPVADGSGFPGLPDDDDDDGADGLSDSADSMDGGTPELAPAPADFPGLPEDSNIPDTGGDSVDSIDSQTTEPEPVADGSGFPGLSDSVDPVADGAFGLESESASPVDFPGLSADSDSSTPVDMADSPFDDDPDQMPAFPDDADGGGMSGLPEHAESKADGELEHQWKQTVQRIKELKTRYVTK
jgi:hypothetical protein